MRCANVNLLTTTSSFRSTWYGVNNPILFSDSASSTSIYRDSSSLLYPDPTPASSSGPEQSQIPSSVNPSALFSSSLEGPPSIYTSSTSTSNTQNWFRDTSPLSDSSSLSAADSYGSGMSYHTSAMSSPASSISSLHTSHNSPSAQRFLLPISPRPRTQSNHLEVHGIPTRSAARSLKDPAQQYQPGAHLAKHQRSISLQEHPAHAPLNLNPDSFSGDYILKNGKKKWLCPCGKTFTRDSDRKRHSEDSTSCPLAKEKLQIESEESNPRFTCERCTKPFSRHDSLDRHRRNPTACSGVPKTSLRQTDYRRAKRRGYEGN